MNRNRDRVSVRMPAEWELHECVWLAWPSAADLWGEDLAPTRQAFVQLCEAIGSTGAGRKAEGLSILVPDADAEAVARRALGETAAIYWQIPFGDIWMRDTAPLFVHQQTGEVVAECFRFNGWGGKYVLEGDDRVAARIAEASRRQVRFFDWVLEGGSVDVDGEGTCLTTEQCLLNPNRGERLTRSSVEDRLAEALGAQKVLWLGEGLMNDHTDGHVDTLARFVAPGRVVCMEPWGPGDPNLDVLRDVASRLRDGTDSAGRRLEVVTLPSPGRVLDRDGNVMPASYVNFYIGNQAVAVPVYGSPQDQAAVATLSRLFPDRRTVAIPAKSLLSGGGAFHCITQQQPMPLP